jgi:predicted phage baseplate assembly protein
VLRPGSYGASPPALKSVRLNTVPARSLTTIRSEVLGRSTGLPFQRFRLTRAPVFPGSTVITVNEVTEGGGVTAWSETLDLFTAGPGDRVYQLIPATGDILFGDGRHGKVPPPDDGSDPTGNIKVTRYQVGGGTAGNVGEGTLTRVLPISGLPSFDATNALSARGGDDEEPVALGVARAPAVVRSRYRAVSAADFEALAKETPDARIARAHALAHTRPGLRAGASPGSITVLLVPNAIVKETLRGPIPLLPEANAAVRRYLDPRRLVTTDVFTAPATFRPVTVDTTLELAPGASLSATRAAAVDALHRYFHALVGGDDGLGWPFGGAIHFSRVFQQLLGVAGVARVDRLAIALGDHDAVSCRDVPIGAGELLFSGDHVVRVRVPA